MKKRFKNALSLFFDSGDYVALNGPKGEGVYIKMSENLSIKEKIEQKLRANFTPNTLEVVNESHLHAGHSGDDGSGESHFHITIRSNDFAHMGRIERHRAVHAALGSLTKEVHAIALDIGYDA